MTRLIDANELKKHLKSYVGKFDDDGFWVELEAVLRGIDFQPTVDAVEVVRCKDCKHLFTLESGRKVCVNANGFAFPKEDYYCSFGERKDD